MALVPISAKIRADQKEDKLPKLMKAWDLSRNAVIIKLIDRARIK